jgi:hypothetical protein
MKNNGRRGILVAWVLAWITVCGCDISVIGEHEKRGEPFDGAVTVRSLDEGPTVHVTWEADAGADAYILMRTEVGVGGIDFKDKYVVRKERIVGATDFLDNMVLVEKSYAYRLDKERGNRV